MTTQCARHVAGVCLVGLAAAQALAANWAASSGSFTNGVNWDTGLVPVAGEAAVIANGGTAQFDGGTVTNLSTVGLGVGSPAAQGDLEMSAGELSSGTFRVGENGGVGAFTLSGGQARITGGMGAFSVAPANGSSGTVTVTGGLLTADNELWIGPTAGGHAFFYLSGGVVLCRNWGVVGRGSTDAWLFQSGGAWSNVVANNFTIGSAGSGVMQLSDGVLYSQNGIYVGELAPGRLEMSGGTVAANWLQVARQGIGTGALDVANGSLWLNALNVGTAPASVAFSGGSLGALNANGVWSAPAALTNSPGAGTLTLLSGDQAGAARVNTYSGALSGPGALAVDAAPGQATPGTVVLSANNTFEGGTTLNGANMLQLGAGGATGWIPGPLALSGGGSLAFARSDTVTNSLAISGSGAAIVQNGPGVLVLTNEAPAFSVATVNAGTILFSSAAAIPGAGTSITINNGGAVAVAGAYTTVAGWLNSGRIATSSAGGLALTADSSEDIDLTTLGGGLYGSLTLGSVGPCTYSGTLTPIGGVYRLGGGSGPLTFASPISSGSVVMNGSGNVALAGENTSADGVTVTRGTLTAAHPGALGSGPTLVSGGVLQISTSVVSSAGVVVTNTGMLQVVPGGTLDGSVVNQAVSAGAGTSSGFVFDGAATFSHTDDVSGSGSLAVIGNGTLQLNTPGQTISQGELWVGNNGSAGNLELSDGTLSVSNWLIVARGTVSGTPQSTLTLSGGTLNKTGTAGTTIIGDINGSVGTLVLTNNALFNAAGGNVLVSTGNGTGKLIVYGGLLNRTASDLVVANGAGVGTVTLYDGAVSNTAGWVYIGYANGSRGTLAVTNGHFYCLNNLRVGEQAGSSGFLQLAGGRVSVGTLYLGEAGSGSAVQTGGTLGRSTATAGEWRIGDAVTGVGTYTLIDGVLDTGTANFQIGATGRGTLNQSGGTFSCGQWPVLGRFLGGVGTYTLSGGTFNQTGAANRLIVGEQGTGTFTVSGTGVANLTGGLSIGHNVGGTGTVNLATGGLIVTPRIFHNNTMPSLAIFNFDGGTLRASGGGVLMQNLSAVNVKAGGAIIDTDTNRVFIAQDLASGVAQDGGLTKLGAGTLTLNGAGSYKGPTTVAAGTLKAPGRALTHRWSFNNSLADSVGGSTATVVGSVTPGASEYTLAGGTRGTSYISLGNNLLPSSNESSATIELWATQRQLKNWSRIFDFGSSTANYLTMTWTRGTAYAQDRVDIIPGGGVSDSMQPYTTNQEFHISMVITPGAGTSGNTLVQWYKMDQAGTTLKSGSISLPWTLATLSQVNMWLGHSQFAADWDANASYNEVRIWNGALTQAQLAYNSLLGPDALPALGASLPADARVSLASAAALDLDGGAATVASLSGGGVLTNGALAVTGAITPGGSNTVGTLTLASATLSGTLLVDVTSAGDSDRIQTAGGLSLSGLSLQIQDLGQLNAGKRYVVAKCAPGALSGTFQSTNLDPARWYVSYNNALGEARLVSRGLLILVH